MFLFFLLEVGETVTPELPSFEHLCKDGQDESQTWNNPEMEAAFIRVQVVKMFEMTHCGKACEPLLQVETILHLFLFSLLNKICFLCLW